MVLQQVYLLDNNTTNNRDLNSSRTEMVMPSRTYASTFRINEFKLRNPRLVMLSIYYILNLIIRLSVSRRLYI